MRFITEGLLLESLAFNAHQSNLKFYVELEPCQYLQGRWTNAYIDKANLQSYIQRRCGMITSREAERLCKSFLGDNSPPRLPDSFAFEIMHDCAWGCRGQFMPARYNSSRAKCIKCTYCSIFFSPNKFVFHSHRLTEGGKYIQPDAANFNSWRRHIQLLGDPPDEVVHAWEDVKVGCSVT